MSYINQILALGSVGVGLIFSLVFHIGTKEKRRNVSESFENIQVVATGEIMSITDWLKEPQFYQVSLFHVIKTSIENVNFNDIKT